MTTKYPPDQQRFSYSLFCILGNRIAAMLISGITILITQQYAHQAPLYIFLYPSISNLISTTCQYEALKHISFITQVLMKCAKTIPVMVMGTFISKKRYSIHEYAYALSISLGTGLFLVTTAESRPRKHEDIEELSWTGVILMCIYIVFDSFTSTIQAKIYEQYHVSTHQMMFFVNLVSTPLLVFAMYFNGSWGGSFNYIQEHPAIREDLLALSISGGVGQNFIYYTLREFGAVTYAVIVTIRQFISIFSSNYLFAHELGAIE
eukprot:TRINITY_DN9513_c0_g4_i1.p1 TRINITY_DN9513_c0_g4~~TRINITY_DN9513_c0_g4_i1.p1  ORF type:complete len:263 (-),score=37.69 TRINITY_DN9513_c0_g4_i1:327-1115(-)